MVARAALLVGGAKVVGGASLLLLNIWVARHLAPSDYGVFAIAVTALLLMDGVVGAAVDAAVIRVSGESRPGTTSAGGAGVVLKLLAGAGLMVLAGASLVVAGRVDVVPVALIIVAGGTGMLVLRSVQVDLQLAERFGWFGIADLTHTAFRVAGVLLALASGERTAAGPLMAYALAPWCAAAVFALATPGIWRRRDSARLDVAAVGQVAVLTLTTTGVGTLVARLDLLLIGVAGSPEEAGMFAIASTLALVPTWLGAYIAPAFTGRILPYCRAGLMQPFLWNVQRVLAIAAAAAVAAGVLIGPAAIALLLPPSYAPAARVVPVLLLAGAAGLVTFPLVLHTLLFLSPRTYVVMDLASLPIVVPLYVVAAREWGAIGVAWVTSAAALAKAAAAHMAASAAVRRAEAEPVLAGVGA